jgi:acyl-coenzyme A thioesterase PaaI-like protein
MSSLNPVLSLWHKLSAYPGGRFLFSKFVQYKAPYFKTVNAMVEELKPNYARLKIKKRRTVENHIGTVHVIAICNLLEMAMGACAEASIPKHLRWIPKGMSVDYTAKAGSDITGIAQIDPEQWRPGDLDVVITALDDKGVVVLKGVIKLWISEKK